MKTTLAIAIAMLLTGCITGAPCSKATGWEGEKCSVLMIPTSGDDLLNVMETLSMIYSPTGKALAQGEVKNK